MPANPWTHQAYSTCVVTLPAPFHENSGWVSWNNPLCLLEYLEKARESSRFRRMQSTLSFLLLTAAEFTTCSVWPLNMYGSSSHHRWHMVTQRSVCCHSFSLQKPHLYCYGECLEGYKQHSYFIPFFCLKCKNVWVILWLFAVHFIHKYWCRHISKNITFKPHLRWHILFFSIIYLIKIVFCLCLSSNTTWFYCKVV